MMRWDVWVVAVVAVVAVVVVGALFTTCITEQGQQRVCACV